MKKNLAVILMLGVVFYAFTACGSKETATAGSASSVDMLKMLPVDAQGVIFIDFHKAMSIEAAAKAIKEDDNYQKYQEFIEKTGIDPEKDIYFIAVAVQEIAGKDEPSGAAVVNMKYNKDSLLTLIAEESEKEITPVDYNGVALYSEAGKESEVFAFLDDSNVVVGELGGVKSCIDVMQKTKENIYKNEALAGLLDKTNKKTLLWGAMSIPQEVMEKAASENPMLGDLKSVNAVTLNFDYASKNITAEIRLESGNAESNKKVAGMLNGLKAFGSMAAAEKPEIGELVNSIEITATDEHVKITASIPEDLIEKLKPKSSAEEE